MATSFLTANDTIEDNTGDTANILNISAFNALSIGSGSLETVLLCLKRGNKTHYTHYVQIVAKIINHLKLHRIDY